MITPAYAPTATERVLPRLALDFTTGVLDPRVTVTRALNTATRVNSSGFIETVNADLPRFDYDPATLAPKGLLIEESRINLASYSEDFRNTADAGSTRPNTYINMTLAQNVTTSPYGIANASDKLVETSATGVHGCYRSGVITAAGTYAYTVRVKPAERFKVQIQFGSTGNTAQFTLQGAGSVDYQLSATGYIRASADGWYYCTMVASPGSGTSVSIIIMDDAGSISYTGDPTKGLYVDCIQVEAGAFATSYIPNLATGTTTRNADVVSMAGTNFSNWWQATTGGMLVRAKQSIITGTRPWVYASDGTADNIISLRGNAANPELYIKATTDQAQIDAGTLVANTSYGLAGAWNTNDCAAAINGGAAVTDASATIPTVDRMLIGSDGTNYLSGWVEKIAFWPQRIISAEVQAFSK